MHCSLVVADLSLAEAWGTGMDRLTVCPHLVLEREMDCCSSEDCYLTPGSGTDCCPYEVLWVIVGLKLL